MAKCCEITRKFLRKGIYPPVGAAWFRRIRAHLALLSNRTTALSSPYLAPTATDSLLDVSVVGDPKRLVRPELFPGYGSFFLNVDFGDEFRRVFAH